MFCNKGCSLKFCKIHWKTQVPEVSFLIKLHTSACNFINKETLAQVFSCEFCEISKNTFFTETSGRLLLVLTGALLRPLQLILYYQQIYFFLAYVKILSIHVWHRCFPVNFAKFPTTPFLQKPLGDCF